MKKWSCSGKTGFHRAPQLFAGVFLALVFFVHAPCGMSQAVRTVHAATYSGWKQDDGNRYYYRKGVKEKGWSKIRGKYYYFNSGGVLQTNRIVGSGARGYYYVDPSGVRVTTPEIRAAVSFVMKNSSVRQTEKQRLKACFKALCRYPYQRIYGDRPSAGRISSYASYMFRYKKGNCYRYASAMAYIARVLGYESRAAVGGVTARSYGTLSPHGWCEVKIGKNWRMIDCSMQRAHPSVSLFLVKRSAYPFRMKCNGIYVLKSANGRISWKAR